MKKTSGCGRYFLFAMLLALPSGVSAETAQQEFAGSWFINPVTQNWTCAVAPGKLAPNPCQATLTTHLGFVKAHPLVATYYENGAAVTKHFFYVGEWGQAQGPGAECWGDSIGVFISPYTVQGAKGEGLVYKGAIHPCTSSGTDPEKSAHWALHSVIKDDNFGGIYVIAQRVKGICGTPPPGATFDPACNFKTLHIGESLSTMFSDDGINFNWTQLLWTKRTDLDIYGLVMENMGGLQWSGFLNFNFVSTPFKIDWANWQMSYMSGPSSWTTIPLYGEIVTLPYPKYPAGVTSFESVRGRYEVWFTGGKDAQGNWTPFPPRSGNRPANCPDDPYNVNMSNMADGSDPGTAPDARWTTGSGAFYAVVDANFNLLQTYQPLTSTVHPLPADYGWSVGNLNRYQTLMGSTIYYSSQDYSICNVKYLNDWNNWAGSGIRFGRIQDQ